MQRHVAILDTGKEWGGGTNSLLELLKRIDKNRYGFTLLFYNNYKKGTDSDIKTEAEKLGVEFLILEQRTQPVIAKTAKELLRLLFFFSRRLKKYSVFLIDYHFRIKQNAEKISGILKNLKIDLLYMNNQPSSNFEGILAARITNIPCIQHSRIGAEINRFEVNAVNNWLKTMICVSQGVKDMFVSRGVNASKCRVVYNGIAPDMKPMTDASEIRNMWGIKEGEILIGTVGSLIKRKRINDLIDALAKLQRQEARGKIQDNSHQPPFIKGGQGGIKCIVIGDGPEKENLQKMASEKGMHGKIIFTGFQSDAVSYINAMDIFVLPSENEGLPRVILEAMLMAKPVVACDVTGPSELVVDGETGFLVPARNPETLTNALSKLAASDDLGRGMGEKGRMRAIERFAIDKYVNGVSKIFEEVLG